MTRAERLLGEFADDWSAGRRPSVSALVERAPAGERDALAQAIAAFLLTAGVPRYSAETVAELMRDPVVLATARALEGSSGLWPALLPRLRRQARLRREAVVTRLAESLGAGGREEKAARYLHELESGTLDSAGVSRRVLDALAAILGTSAAELERAGDFPGLGGPAPATAWFRGGEAAGAPSGRGAARRPSEEEWDELDRLFLGGREEAGA
jgi:hypothetical protein